MANSAHVEVVKKGATAIKKWREAHPQERFDLSGAALQGADLREANLEKAELTKANLEKANLREANLQGAELTKANLQGAHLGRAHLQGAHLREVNLQGADLREAHLSKARMAYVKNATKARSLETVQFDDGDDALYFDTCNRPWLDSTLDWEALRTIGRLPLFGASYTALILIPIVFAGLALYNKNVHRLHALLDTVVIWLGAFTHQNPTMEGTPLYQVHTHIRSLLQPWPLPDHSLFILVSTVLLAIGATLYTLRCPRRIKEFSSDQWCDQLRRSLLHYWPLAWQRRWSRCICIACYFLGGGIALVIIGLKVWGAAVFIWENTAISWPWQ
jgi:hypothetical protein